MRLKKVHGTHFRAVCVGCQQIFDSDKLYADLDGPAYSSYWCIQCADPHLKQCRRTPAQKPNREVIL